MSHPRSTYQQSLSQEPERLLQFLQTKLQIGLQIPLFSLLVPKFKKKICFKQI